MIDRKALFQQANREATNLRDSLDLDPFAPVDPYRVAALLGIKVVFLGASMEGFYFKGPSPRILLSAARPLPRRAFTCAHEIGHHVFGHGSTIDVLQEDERSESDIPEEVLANAFASFLLMPTVGLRGAFASRRWKISAPTPQQLYAIACQFGVGYRTLLNHLVYSLREISEFTRETLAKSTPQKLRLELVGPEYDGMLVLDHLNEATTLDAEKESAIVMPSTAAVVGNAIMAVTSVNNLTIYRAVRRGTVSVTGLATNCEIRVMPQKYEGNATNRFLEDPDED